MPFYIRKVDSSQWEDDLPSTHNFLDMAVDGITNCCRTSENTLSIWKTDNRDPYSLENQKLITAMAMSLDRPIAMTFVFLSDEELQALGLEIVESPGYTPYDELVHNHRDISNLTLERMGRLAWKIHEKVNDDNEMKLIPEEDITLFVKSIFPDANALPAEKREQKKWKKIYQ